MPAARNVPIDPRGPRWNQGALALSLAIAYAVDAPAVIPVWAAFLALGVALGPRFNPVLRLYADVVRPRLDPPSHLEDPRPPRFAATLGAGVLAVATLAFQADLGGAAWVLALVVGALAALASLTGICVGCELYATARHVPDHGRRHAP